MRLQSQLWGGEGEGLGALAATEHAEANRLFWLATQTISYDANTVTGYAQAVRRRREAQAVLSHVTDAQGLF